MIDHNEITLDWLLDDVLSQGSHTKRQLVSYTKRIPAFNPLSVLELGKDENRFFWKRNDDYLYLVGIGNLIELAAKQVDYQAIYEEWIQLVDKAFVHNPYLVPGTGLVSFGGIAFDDRKETSQLWENFSASQLRVPKFLFVKYKNDYYLTINLIVQDNEHVDLQLQNIQQEEQRLLQDLGEFPQLGTILRRKEIDTAYWKQTIEKAKHSIQNHLAEKIVLARELRLKLSAPGEMSPVVKKLIETQPNSYVFAFEQGNECFLGATPERLVRLEQHKLQSMCLAGTAPRGENDVEDKRVRHELLNDKKNREEHDFVVQMIRRAIEPYCEDIYIPDNPTVYPLKNLQHLHTPVTAILKHEYHIFDIIRQLHPTPALGGTPKEVALAFIRDDESLDRGWYGAPIGWIDHQNNGEFAVAIRSGLIQNDEASLFAGCGIVKDSDVEAEYEETKIKFLPMLHVLGGQR
ncbi:MAG TPA: isochorismate synthase [Cerasibacillus sp.]|uniref:isochorismate synthase n=1 Tax=Cerasibacillus sp. TaxID=2498711 RepID=UPI002F41262D